ncbi:MAG: histidine phosphatase family protein [Synergistes sp.]|nr:histidine phosphatase family protein [Synergistes sp.]
MRHAKPSLPFGGRVYYGQTDFPLSDEGESDARMIADAVKDTGFDAVYSSDLCRAVRTAKIVAPDLHINTTPMLREIDLGDWEGKSYDEVREEFKEIYDSRGSDFTKIAPPRGETFAQLQVRSVKAFNEIADHHKSGRVLIVSHGAFIWSVVSHIMGLNLSDMFFYPLDYCGIHFIEERCGRLGLIRYNWRPGLLRSRGGSETRTVSGK